MVYICSPLRTNETHTMEQNIAQAKEICRRCALNGVLGMAVHLYFTQFLDDLEEAERNCGIQHGLTMLSMCKEIWVFGNTISSGMKAEIEYAITNGIPIKYHADIDEWLTEFTLNT